MPKRGFKPSEVRAFVMERLVWRILSDNKLCAEYVRGLPLGLARHLIFYGRRIMDQSLFLAWLFFHNNFFWIDTM